MKIMTRKNSACLMPLLLFFYLAMSPVALANDTGIDVNVIAPDGDIFLNMVESGGIAARRGIFQRPTPREKTDWFKRTIDRVNSGVKREKWREECLERAKKSCQSNLLQNSTESCHQYFLKTCQPNLPTKVRKRIQEVQDFLKE